jgi:iron complex transport system substrate-binding protein
MRVMSLNLCTDGLLLDLLPDDRIASVTYLSRSPSNSFRSSDAAGVPINYGSGEEALIEKPDLVLAGTYTTTATRALLKKLGVRVLEVPPANNFEEIRAVTRSVARALGEEQKAETLLAKMDATLSSLSAVKRGDVIRVSGWNGGGSIPGKGTLFDAILTAAGGVNIASSLPDTRAGSFDIEELLMAHPDVLAYGADSNGAPALRTDADQHPLILKVYAHRRVRYPEVLYSCGVPEIADAAVEFRIQLLAAMTPRDRQP